ncbi:hypothetical protein [Streptomyces sp. NPDC004726]
MQAHTSAQAENAELAILGALAALRALATLATEFQDEAPRTADSPCPALRPFGAPRRQRVSTDGVGGPRCPR